MAVVNENTVDGAANGYNLKHFNRTVIEDGVNGKESSTKVNGKVGDMKISNGEQPVKASGNMVNGDVQKDHLKPDLNKEGVNEDIKSNSEQD